MMIYYPSLIYFLFVEAAQNKFVSTKKVSTFAFCGKMIYHLVLWPGKLKEIKDTMSMG